MTSDGGTELSRIDLRTNIAGIRLVNPLILASGIVDETGSSMANAVKGGAGGVVTKSLSLKPRMGHTNPVVVELPCGLINAMGLPNPGIEEYAKEIEVYRNETADRTPLIASVFGASIEEYAEAARSVSIHDVDGIEINGSCPNARGLGLEFGQDQEIIRELVGAVKGAVDIPVFFKLTPNTSDIASLALAAQKGGADGLVAINTLKAMKIDIRTRTPILTNVAGGLSGEAILPVGVRCVYEIASSPEIDIPIIGVGGASTAEDVLEYMMAGASAVQVGTAVYSEGIGVFSRILEGLRIQLQEMGMRSIDEVIGRALEGSR